MARFSIVAIVVVALAAAAAAAPGPASRATPTGERGGLLRLARTLRPTPERGGTPRFAPNFDPQTLNPLGTSVDNGSIFVMHQLYDTLVKATATGVGPGLASSWKVSRDGRTWTFRLRNARFSSGDPV